MAKSKFLEYQDKNNDGLIDKCGEQPIVPEAGKECPDCTPNPNAIVPDWKTQGDNEPWHNAKECTYEVTITTLETSIMPSEDATEEESRDYVLSLFHGYSDIAADSLIVNFNKKDIPITRATVLAHLQQKRYDLDARRGSHLKLLYAIDYDIFAPLEELVPGEEEEEDDDLESQPSGADIVVTFEGVSNLKLKLVRIQKALFLYGVYYKVYRAIDNGNLVFEESGKILDLDPYGDLTMFGSSILSKILPALESFLNSKELNIPNVGGVSGIFKDKVIKLTLTFAPNYSRLKKIEAYTEGCADPVVLKGKVLRVLNDNGAFKDVTAMGYFTQVDKMHQALTARVPMHWMEYVKKFTFPTVVEKTNYRKNASPEDGETEANLSCLARALVNEGKQLGQDILDPAFSIGDAISYKFHLSACKDEEGAQKEREDLGIALTREQKKIKRKKRRQDFLKDVNTVQDPNNPKVNKSIYAFAKEQAYKELATNQNSFETMCADFIATGQAGSLSIDDIFTKSLDRIKLCGMQALLLDTMQCLMKGIKLEDALASITKAALSAMSIENFGILFVGLPPGQQERLNQMVKTKLASGDFFKQDSQNQVLADQIAGNYNIKPPWEDEELAKQNDPVNNPPERTLAQQFDLRTAQKRLSTDVVMQVYISALIDEYADNLLSMVDLLNEFPGAPLIANIIATMTCPAPPVFDPSVMDFIKDVELPFCRNVDDIVLPKISNPFGWIPSKMDISAVLFEAVTLAIQQALIKIIMTMMIKICELFGSFVCNILETTGDLAKALVTGNKDEFANIIKESICGDDASDEDVNDTIEDMMNTLGPGAGAFADQGEMIQFSEDVSSATTRKELTNAFLGDCSNDFLNIVDSLIEYEYPALRPGLSNKENICAFFKNSGNLFPADIKARMNDFVNQLPENDLMPANPSLCADPESVERFCELRTNLLKGRATEAQAKEMCDNLQDDIKDNLEDLGKMMQDTPGYIAGNMPAMVSDPGCDNGLIPFESEEAAATAGLTIADAMEQLKMDYVEDMLGNGGTPFTDADWGLLNMLLADTSGNALSTHNRKANRMFGPTMNLTTNESVSWWDINPYFLFLKPMPTIFQKDALPLSVGEWMRDQAIETNLTFATTNTWLEPEIYGASFERLGFKGWFGDDVDLTQIPDQGYNSKFKISFKNDEVQIVRAGRKLDPDVSMEYHDNCKGRKKDAGRGYEGGTNTFDYGFKLDMFLSDLHKKDDVICNIPGNNVRINIEDIENLTAPGDFPSIFSLFNPLSAVENVEEMFAAIANPSLPDKPDSERKYEFFARDDTFDNVDLTQYPQLLSAFQSTRDSAPQLILLKEIMNQENGTNVKLVDLEGPYDQLNERLMNDLKAGFTGPTEAEIALGFDANGDPTVGRSAYNYGAAFDNLQYDDFDYMAPMEYQNSAVAPRAGDYDRGPYTPNRDAGMQWYNNDTESWGLLYADIDMDPPGNEAFRLFDSPRNSDMLLGISRNQYNNEVSYYDKLDKILKNTRIFYLNPAQHGGSYKRPGMYVVPLKNKGWMGFIDVVFPPAAACPEADDDLVDFGPIQKRVDDSYSRIPEDQRLRLEPQCVVELPYNRILERSSVAGLEALITGAIQIYISTHFVKCMPMFTFIKPSFSDNYSNLFVSYIVEGMEASLKDAQDPFREFFNTFKDNEFWYAFLEQSVQLYARLVDDGAILDVPYHVQEALARLNDMQTIYDYPTKKDLINAIKLGDEPWYQIFNLPGFRGEKNFEAIQATEEDAKLILIELVARELNSVSERMENNLETAEMSPEYDKLAYWFLTNHTGGHSLKLKGPFIETVSTLEEPPAPYYTNGGQLYVDEARATGEPFKEGDDYIGYYHVSTDAAGNKSYMAGSEHIEAEHDVLAPYENLIIMKNANDDDLGSISAYEANRSTCGNYNCGSQSKDFYIEQYVSIDGVKMSPTAAATAIASQDPNLSLSEVYRGTLEHVTDDDGEVVGLKGELGVRNGLQFYYIFNGEKYAVADAEIDALDVSCGAFEPATPSSKLLLCLIDHLIADQKFRMLTEYIFPLNKFTAFLAIYNDLALLPSVGEKIFNTLEELGLSSEEGDKKSRLGMALETAVLSSNPFDDIELYKTHPGLWLDTDALKESIVDRAKFNPLDRIILPDPFNFDGVKINGVPNYGGNEGWEIYSVRKPRGLGQLFGDTTWDQWDQVLLRNSKNRIKQMFKTYYYGRDFKPGDSLYDERPSKVRTQRVKDLIKPLSFIDLLPWHKRKKLRPNPMGKNNETCKSDNSNE